MTLLLGVAGGEGRRERGRGGRRRLVELLFLLLRGCLCRIRIGKRELQTSSLIVWDATHPPCFGGGCYLLLCCFGVVGG